MLRKVFETPVVVPVVVPEVVTVEPVTEVTKAEKPKRCQHASCKTKLMLSDFACKCENYYCSSHRHAESHSCSYDFKKHSHSQLEKQLVKSVAAKLDRV